MSLKCFNCGCAIFKNGIRGRNPKRCKKCRLAFRAGAARDQSRQAKHACECTHCGSAFRAARKSQPYCSTVCFHLANRKRIFLVCENTQCSKEFQTTPSRAAKGRRYCCRECSYPPPFVCQNPKCGCVFRMKHRTNDQWTNKGKYCCPECYRDHRWGYHRPRRKSSRRAVRSAGDRSIATSLRKRCKQYGLTFDPACTRQAVLNRDGWMCQKCGKLCNKEYKLNPVTKVPSLRNAEHDHIIPLSVSGSLGNVFENSQCLCRQCNAKKRDKPEGQLRLCLEEDAWGVGVRVRSQQHSKSLEAIRATVL